MLNTKRIEDGYRRIIASPKPIDIYEIDAIKALVDAHQLSYCSRWWRNSCSCNSVQVLKGASAVIEKDYTAAKLSRHA